MQVIFLQEKLTQVYKKYQKYDCKLEKAIGQLMRGITLISIPQWKNINMHRFR